MHVHHKLVRIPRVEQPVHGPVTLKLHLSKLCSNGMESLCNRQQKTRVSGPLDSRKVNCSSGSSSLLFLSHYPSPLFFLFTHIIRLVSSLTQRTRAYSLWMDWNRKSDCPQHKRKMTHTCFLQIVVTFFPLSLWFLDSTFHVYLCPNFTR